MKAKVYFFRLVIGLSAFALGIGIYFIWQHFSTKTVSAIPAVVKPVATASPVFVPLPPVVETTNSVDEKVETEEFYPDGDYYLIGDLPKEFKDFDYLTITANKYEIEKDGTSYWKAILPEGFIFTKTKFKFVRININNRHISFETENKKGISFKFIGFFPEVYQDNNMKDWVYLEGDLIKLKNGKRVEKIKTKFGYISGC